MNPHEEISRILREQTDRIDRLENAEYREAVPNPLVDAGVEMTESTVSASTAAKSAGSMQWGDSWGISEWNPPDYVSSIIPAEDAYIVFPGAHEHADGQLSVGGRLSVAGRLSVGNEE